MSNDRGEFSPLFLIVSERCGGNLLMEMVSAHPELHSPLPPHIFRLIAVNRLRYSDLRNKKNWDDLVDITLRFVAQVNEPWKSGLTAAEIDAKVSERSAEELLRAIYEAEVEAQGARYMMLKENEVFRFMPFLLLKFPASRFIWQVRDPRDMLTSFKRSSLFSKLMSNSVDVWQLEQQGALNVYPFLREEGRMLFQTYEALLRDPEETLATLCRFIGVEFSESMLAFHESEGARRRATTSALRENVAKPLMAENARKYLSELTEDEIKEVESTAGDLMEQLGYELEYPPEKTLDERLADRQAMILEDRSTTEADRQNKAARVGTIRKMLQRPLRARS